MFAFLIAAILSLFAPIQTSSPVATSSRRPVEAWAFCGVHPDAANAWLAVHSLALAHIDATFGPCLPPDWTSYTTANPGQRYAEPAVYSRQVELNASVGMATVVYDARLWSTDSTERQNAIDFWTPQLDHIAAWDMGDEFDPRFADWPILIERWRIMVESVEPATHVAPYTNHLPDAAVIEQAIADLGADALSFDCYDVEQAVALTRTFAPRTDSLMVAVNALDYGQGAPTPGSITTAMTTLHDAGADRFLIFGGGYPYAADLTPDPAFGGGSLVDVEGHATALAWAVLAGSTS